MALVAGSKIIKPGGEKLDKLEEQVSHVSTVSVGIETGQYHTALFVVESLLIAVVWVKL